MPPWVQAIILGIVQGLTEFIPVSSSAHLVLVPYLAGWEHPGVAFDIAMHLGTTAAVIVYFWRELMAMGRGVLGGRDEDSRIYRRLAILVVVASIPVGLVGVLLEEQVGAVFEQPLVVGGLLLVTAAFLTAAERSRTLRVRRAAKKSPRANEERAVWTGDWVGTPVAQDAQSTGLGNLPVGHDDDDPAGVTLDRITFKQAITAGLFQAVAILPGVSRSGSTITGGMMSGLTREAATRFSFLLSLPAMFGAFLLGLPDLSEPGDFSGAAIAGGVVASFVSGYAAVRFLVRLVSRDRLTGFARYCVFLAIVTLIAYQFLGPPSTV